MPKAHIDVVVTMSLDEARDLLDVLQGLDSDHPTDDLYHALDAAIAEAENV